MVRYYPLIIHALHAQMVRRAFLFHYGEQPQHFQNAPPLFLCTSSEDFHDLICRIGWICALEAEESLRKTLKAVQYLTNCYHFAIMRMQDVKNSAIFVSCDENFTIIVYNKIGC